MGWAWPLAAPGGLHPEAQSERPCPRAGGASVRQGHFGRPRKNHQGSLGARQQPVQRHRCGKAESDVCGEQSKEGPKGRGSGWRLAEGPKLGRPWRGHGPHPHHGQLWQEMAPSPLGPGRCGGALGKDRLKDTTCSAPWPLKLNSCHLLSHQQLVTPRASPGPSQPLGLAIPSWSESLQGLGPPWHDHGQTCLS